MKKEFIRIDKMGGFYEEATENEARYALKGSCMDVDKAIAEIRKGHAQQTTFGIWQLKDITSMK